MVELVAKRYGTAIFELAKEQDAVMTLQEEILAIKGSFEDPELKEFLTQPKIPVNEKISVLENALSDKVGHDILGLLILVINKGRQDHISQILEEVLDLIDAHNGRVKAYISSAEALSDKQKTDVINQLATLTKKEILPNYEIDPSLIGGLVIRIGDRIVDNSIKGHFHSMSRELLETQISVTE
jgi:F-type H+-transporting ATPase subunit delta